MNTKRYLQQGPSPDINMEGVRSAFSFLAKHYFRAEAIIRDPSLEKLSSNDPVIFVANHSGMSCAYDYFVLDHMLREKFSQVDFFTIAEPDFFAFRILRQFGIKGFLPPKCVLATKENLNEIIEDNKSAMIFPEGDEGLLKGFNKKYQLQRFSSSFIHIAIKYKRDIVPVYIINAEFLNPNTYRLKWTDPIARFFGLPFLPVGFSFLLVLLVPALYYSAMPVKLRYIFGPRVKHSEITTKPYDQVSKEEIRQWTDEFQERMQKGILEDVDRYTEPKFNVAELNKEMSHLGPKAIKTNPLAWPFVFQFAALKPNATPWQKVKAFVTAFVQVIPVLGWPLYILVLLLQGPYKPPSNK